jgi:hypothetical protein
MFAIVKTAGNELGRVKSVHRSFNAAMKKQPTNYYGLVNIGKRKVKAGEIHINLIDLLNRQNELRRQGRAVTGGPNDWMGE